jgi:L-amino acid N-acyltransferase YncA
VSDRITAAAEPMAHAHPLYVPPPYQDSVEAGRLILRDGSTAFIRIAQPADREPLREFFGRLSPESQQQCSFSLAAPGGEWLSTLCDASNPRQQLTLVVLRTAGGNPRIIATGAYLTDQAQDDTAEVALAVADPFHGQGLGSLLLERLALLAVSHGITQFWALTHVDNRPMLEVLGGVPR